MTVLHNLPLEINAEDENVFMNKTQIIIYTMFCLLLKEGKSAAAKNPEIACDFVLYSRPLTLNLNPGPLMQGEASLDFLWRVL